MRTILTLCALVSAAVSPGVAAQEVRPGAPPSELPLHTAIANGDLDEVRRLLGAGADPNAAVSISGADRSTPLSVAFLQWPGEQGSVEVVRLLLGAGADPNGVFNMFGAPGGEEIPLGFAASSPELLRMLLEAGADPNVGWCSGGMETTAMLMAEMSAQTESLALLMAAGAHRSSLELAMTRDSAEAALHAAVSEHDVVRVKRLLDAGSDPNTALAGLSFVNDAVDRVTPLRLALSFGDDGDVNPESRNEVVRLLLAAGADANEPVGSMCGADSPTPLLKAVLNGDEDVVELLLKAGAEPNAAAEAFGASLLRPLVAAAGYGHIRMVQLLLDAGADPNSAGQADGARFSALDVAVSTERTEIADMLRARGAAASPAAAAAPEEELPGDFAVAYASCSAGGHFESGIPELGVDVRYEIVGPEAGGCRVSLTYLSNPNPAREHKALLLTLDPQQRFMDEIEAGMQSCMRRDASRFNCAGPLVEVLTRDAGGLSVARLLPRCTVLYTTRIRHPASDRPRNSNAPDFA